MKVTSQIVFFLLLETVVALPALQHDSHALRTGTQAEPSWSALSGSIQQMHAAMILVKPSGDSDLDFVRLMLPHHQAAIDMAKVQLLYGKDPQMQRLAQEIIADQQSEIELMQLWMKDQSSNPNRTPAFHATTKQKHKEQ